MPDDTPTAPTTVLPATGTIHTTLAAELASTDFGKILTSPLASRVIRAALGMLVTFIGAKVFKAQDSGINVEDYVELLVVLLGSIGAIWYRYKSTGTIKSVADAAGEVLPAILQATTPAMRQDLMNVVKARNPEVHDLLVKVI